ncbi:carbamoyl-phosphate synthase (glutamine-hydrolyzing) [Pusillibacter faecalis]|uniref:Multifunctional fusion protein n=1 Tax=Pusillibacter faecalis TaxID=2714358 RepID=A0A810QD11_9FIRM|nr:carbamoyl-phosphate synthase large subunit [Pusillibacter faecalis]MBS5659576.1 carbamoyl-phosphate synthase large subunit [Oscillibacter sp.]BCK84062.1 carbamoyl-phosphate synthase (glutamine-hydrolyzing) [Pusillibacter faecalis]
MPLDTSIQKVLVIGSGPIVIGQAAEFDYAGAQACRILKEAGVNVVLCNSNPATIMTDQAMADEIYLEPLTAETIKRIILKERPDSILAGLGGQTGLTLAMQLDKEGFLAQQGVRLLGTDARAISRAEDRELFKEAMAEIGQPVIASDIAETVEEALAVAEKIGYPVIVRPAFTLGGAGGGAANNPDELRIIAGTGLDASPITQVLIEKAIFGWKEIEFETMRDGAGNVIAVCSMENLDPVGVHTGDSIVVAPTQTLADKEFQMLRKASLDIITHLGIVGGCNVQLALNPDSFEYAVIEVNPRVSRSSALASKATGYPIAKITTKIALGYRLDEIKNDITGKTCACFEPTLDYIVVKMPKWPFDKFADASRTLGTQMKATGEVMSIAPSFEMALMKAVRGAEIGQDSLNRKQDPEDTAPIWERLRRVDDHRLFTVFEALKSGVSVDEIFGITRIDRWFLHKLKNMAEFELALGRDGLTAEHYETGKRLGYPDDTLRRLSGAADLPVPAKTAVYKMVDTCGAEFDAETPYFYSSFDRFCESRAFPRSGRPVIMVLGSGPIRIGQGIEFDYSSVHCVWTLKELGYDVVIVNNNPETVSTDYDTADRLYFEPLFPEDVMHIIAVEKPVGVVVAFGGQTAIKLTKFLDSQGIPILGTSAESIDMAEDRERFDELLERFHIKRPQGRGVTGMEEALSTARELGYPVLLRPSYVIGGQNMVIAHNDEDVRTYMEVILSGKIENPVLVDQYLMGKELEVDVISDGKDVLIPGVMQHIERTGVHSGDSIAVYPPFSIGDKMLKTIIDCSEKLALSLKTRGLINIQYLIYQGELYVIEVNPRASRTVPYISKVTGVPMVDLATRVMVGQPLAALGYGTGLYQKPPYVAVKVPVFSFEKITDANAALSPEMKSTGEVLGLGKNMQEALFKGLVSAGYKVEKESRGGVLISVNHRDQPEIVNIARKLDEMGYKLYATEGTAHEIAQLGTDVEVVGKLGRDNKVFEMLEGGEIDYVILTGSTEPGYIRDFIHLNHRCVQLGIPCLTSLDTAGALADILASRYNQRNTELVDICHLRTERQRLKFAKMQTCGNDYIFLENFDGSITCPESLCVSFCDRHYGVGADGIILMERSQVADAKMRMFNSDGSEGKMAGNALRCMGKYLYDFGIVRKEELAIETGSGIKTVSLYTSDGKVTSACVDMGRATLDTEALRFSIPEKTVVNYPVRIAGRPYSITCVDMGNPHCVVFCPRVDAVDVEFIGPRFEHAPYFPERTNTEFIRVVNPNTIKMRVWERGSGETLACGTGACAAVVAAVANGFCSKGSDVTVRVKGGDLVVHYTDETVTLTGDAKLVYTGEAEY